ncbi:unnamed protein product [Cylicostephanus goldi]|uniref:Uncharacterized protein n=1 Tax=Cylicostephanus goldi TaxID=71465 RepID=A0A3P6SV98_CYLGO|nr:unnamed protein product [Cylicostephanus goldi]
MTPSRLEAQQWINEWDFPVYLPFRSQHRLKCSSCTPTGSQKHALLDIFREQTQSESAAIEKVCQWTYFEHVVFHFVGTNEHTTPPTQAGVHPYGSKSTFGDCIGIRSSSLVYYYLVSVPKSPAAAATGKLPEDPRVSDT